MIVRYSAAGLPEGGEGVAVDATAASSSRTTVRTISAKNASNDGADATEPDASLATARS